MVRLRLIERARHFAQRGWFVKLWFVPAWAGLGLASLMIAALDFRRIAAVLGEYRGTEVPAFAISCAQQVRAVQIRQTVQLAAHYAPWRADCYPQAIVARLLLGLYRLPSVLCMGLRREAGSPAMAAHAWVRCGDVAVTGGLGEADHRVVGVFVGKP